MGGAAAPPYRGGELVHTKGAKGWIKAAVNRAQSRRFARGEYASHGPGGHYGERKN